MSSSPERAPGRPQGPARGERDERASSQRRAHARRVEKAAGAFRTISEVADDLEVPQHVLRFWETKFPQIKPMKRGGGRRYYRPEDVDLLRAIRGLLYDQGYTIKGVQKLMREGSLRLPGDGTPAGATGPVPDGALPDGDSGTEPGLAAQLGQTKAMLDLPLFKSANLSDTQIREIKSITTELQELRDRLKKVLD
jgi:DNA-binding transcriptional MerR regulator